MPRMDGTELLQRLRAAGGGPASIVLTAHGSLEAAVSIIYDLGAFWFLEKPVQSAAGRRTGGGGSFVLCPGADPTHQPWESCRLRRRFARGDRAADPGENE